ncbi:helix-turn-helix domain-containing protein [Umezawaea beigongshangensis]|uniref:helix-turn-helix domain-containing protein n=1 Tax=Umezawaea beigongshangensis TaxID=2780383 RepID=UPI0018F1FB02|nr:helix-turn-helix transcriptional regulator [Umezawaea beigongshangensis]
MRQQWCVHERIHIYRTGDHLGWSQVHCLVSRTPERLSLQVLSAFCEILGCIPADLVATTAETSGVRTSETGAVVQVVYGEHDCRRADRMPADPATNTMRCYPMWWTPTGALTPVLDWSHKYVVTAVTTDDRTGGSSLFKTAYEYPEGAGLALRLQRPGRRGTATTSGGNTNRRTTPCATRSPQDASCARATRPESSRRCGPCSRSANSCAPSWSTPRSPGPAPTRTAAGSPSPCTLPAARSSRRPESSSTTPRRPGSSRVGSWPRSFRPAAHR